MTARGWVRGWPIIHIGNEKWVYEDTNEPFIDDTIRPCKKCNRLPTKEGYDACIGHIEGATSVCCGHGINNRILVMKNRMGNLWE